MESLQSRKISWLILENNLLINRPETTIIQKLKHDQRLRERDQKHKVLYWLVRYSSRATSNFPCQQANNSTKHHKCTLNTFKNQSCMLQDYTNHYATPCGTSTNVMKLMKLNTKHLCNHTNTKQMKRMGCSKLPWLY